MSDKNLIEAAKEVQAVLASHGCAGTVVLCSQTHVEFVVELSPPWSCARMEPDGVRFKSLASDFGGDKARQKKQLEDTVGMIVALEELHRTWADQFRGMMKAFGKAGLVVEHVTRLERLGPG